MTATLNIDPQDPEVTWIMGRPNFWCAPIANTLRKSGQQIAQRSEDEQAAVILWLIGKYVEHGTGWKDKANAELRALAEERKETK